MLIEKYAKFIRENHIRELLECQLDVINKSDIPIMKFFSHLTREQIIESGVAPMELQLKAFEEGNAEQLLLKGLRDWEQDKLEGGLSRTALHPSDLIFIYNAQRNAFNQLIPKFVDDSKTAIELSNELATYYTNAENEAFNVLFRIRKESEDALKESEERFRSIAESTTDAVLITDQTQKIIYANSATSELTKYHEDELNNIGIEKILDLDAGSLQQLLSSFTSEPNPLINIPEFSVITKDQNNVPIDISISKWETEEGLFYGLILHDISQRKLFENRLKQKAEELDRSNSALQQFAYVASHDMREPLRMITSFLQLLERKHRDNLPNEALEYVNMSLDGAKRLSNLINDLLDYSRTNAGKPNLKEIKLQKVVNDVLLNLSEVIKDRNVKIDIGEIPHYITIDPIKFTQLLQNLISNSIKFNTNPVPEIRLWADEKSHDWQFNLQDNGIGMTEDQLNQAFVMFRRLHGKEYPGTGIGLALCKRIIEQHNGNIWVESIPSIGSTFHFTIPKKVVLNPVKLM